MSPDEEIVRHLGQHPTHSQHYFQPKTTDNFQKRRPFLQQKPKEELSHNAPISQTSDTQLFNVGYSVSFANNAKNLRKQQKPRITESSDIITGTRKGQEFVQKPPPGFATHEFASNSLLDASGNSFQHIPQSIVQTNLLPLQQKYYDTSENPYESQQREISDVKQQNHIWHNLSPNLEIFKSTDLSENKPLNSAEFKPSHQFDHANALGKSEGFDYSNAINSAGGTNNSPPPQSSAQQFRQKVNPAGPVLFDNAEDTQIPKQPNLRLPSNVFLPPITYNHNLQTSASSFVPHAKGQSQQVPKLPIDTRLLRNPVLTTKERPVVNNPHSIPIHFDTTLVQEAMNKELLAQQHRASVFHVPPKEPLYEQASVLRENVKPEQFFQEQQEQLKIHRKPQQNEKNDNFKRHKEEYVLRHPRQNRYHVARPDRNIQIHLRPPPMSAAYQRRVYKRPTV